MDETERDFNIITGMLDLVIKEANELQLNKIAFINALICLIYNLCEDLGKTPKELIEFCDSIGLAEQIKAKRKEKKRDKELHENK